MDTLNFEIHLKIGDSSPNISNLSLELHLLCEELFFQLLERLWAFILQISTFLTEDRYSNLFLNSYAGQLVKKPNPLLHIFVLLDLLHYSSEYV